MKRDRANGFALIIGTVCFLITMAFHPTSGSLEGLVRESAVRVGTHALGLATIPVLFFGFLGLNRRLHGDTVWAPAALVTYGFGSVAAMCAAVINGFVAPAFAARMAPDPAIHDTARAVLSYSFQLNAGFAKVFMVAAAAALLLWSVAIVRTRALPSWVAWVGGVLGVAGLVAVLGGFLGTGVHEFGLFVLCFAGWTVSIGVLLSQASTADPVA